jgi:hypothetical protein
MARAARTARTAALSAAAAAALLVALVLDAGRRGGPARLLAAGCALADSGPGCGFAGAMAASGPEAPLTWNDDGSISADTVRQWRKRVEDRGAFPVPDNSFFDATNSDVWSDKQVCPPRAAPPRARPRPTACARHARLTCALACWRRVRARRPRRPRG